MRYTAFIWKTKLSETVNEAIMNFNFNTKNIKRT